MVKKCLYIREKCCNTLQFSLAVTGLDTVSSILNKKSWKYGTGIGTYCKNKLSKLFFFGSAFLDLLTKNDLNFECSYKYKWKLYCSHKNGVFLGYQVIIAISSAHPDFTELSGKYIWNANIMFCTLENWAKNRNYAFVYIKQLLIETE